MPRHRKPLLLGIGALTVLVVAGGAAQSNAPQSDPMLAEIRAMRADLNQRLEANIRVQLLLGRLTLQEQRTNTVVRQLAEVSEKLRTQDQTKAQIEAAHKMFGFDPNKPVSEEEDNFLIATFKAQSEQIAKGDVELRKQQADLSAALVEEQARWAAFNAQLAELERLFEKPRK